LERLLRPKELSKEIPAKGEKELVAAIAAAIALQLKARSPKLKYPLSNIKSPISEQRLNAWKSWGRYRQLMNRREVKGHRG